MKWFFALNDEAPHFSSYADMIKVAVHTARRHTTLEPYFLYDGRRSDFMAWLADHGVTVVQRRWRLLEEYRRVAHATGHTHMIDSAAGVFLRTEVPAFCREQGWSDKQVLYTDCDIMFVGDPAPLLPDLRGRFFAAAPEEEASNVDAINSGVMLMNVPAMLGMEKAFDSFVHSRMAECAQFTDQYAYREFFRRGWDMLPITLNWKPYWGENRDARIVHFHGAKPFLRASIASGEAYYTVRDLARGAFDHYCAVWDEALAAAG